MEISSLLGTGFHLQILTFPSPSSFPRIPSLSPPTPRASISNLNSATSTTATPVKEPNPTRPHSKSYLQRKSALLEVQQSSDLNSALQNFGGILKPQDLNVIIRHFGKLGKWHHLSEVPKVYMFSISNSILVECSLILCFGIIAFAAICLDAAAWEDQWFIL